MSSLRPLLRLIPVAVVAFAVALFVASSAPSVGGSRTVGGASKFKQEIVSGACDVDGVLVSYDPAFRTEPTLGYAVVNVAVADIAWPSCAGAELRVDLTLTGSTTAAAGAMDLVDTDPRVTPTGDNATATLPVRLEGVDPDAAAVTNVAVTLDGGETPVPDECATMRIGNIQVGTLYSEEIEGTNPFTDLIYSLLGADTVTSLQGDDCIVTGADDDGDTVTVGHGDNVVITGPGADVITAGNGRNRIWAGDGNDEITVGHGKNNMIDGGDGDDVCYVPKSVRNIDLESCERVDL